MRKEELIKLLNNLTLEEKIGQLVQLTGDFFGEESEITGPLTKMGITQKQAYLAGSVIGINGAEQAIALQKKYLEQSRHKIPLIFMADIIHGCNTIFPTPLTLSQSFNPEAARITSEVAAKEATIQGHHITFAPMCDLARDARWGRNMETSGEDPYLSALFAQKYVEGFQNGEYKIGACTKHFAGYGMVQAGREYNLVDISERFLREWHFPSYKAAIDAGSYMVMTAFNTINSVPATGNKWLFTDVLREEMGFKGAVISDWGAVLEQINHQTAANSKEAAIKALSAGCDMEMMTPCYYLGLKEAIENNKVDIEVINTSVMRILELKNNLGLFENPYHLADPKDKQNIFSDAHKKVALEAAVESIVLIENKNILPISIDKCALTGPLASCGDYLGPWSWKGDTNQTPTLEEVLNIPTYDNNFLTWDQIKQDIVIYAGGEYSYESGEAKSKTNIKLPQKQVGDVKKLKENNKKVIFLLFNGRPMDLTNIKDYCDAILVCGHLGTMAAEAIKQVISGLYNPSAKLTMSFPRNVGQCPIYYNDFNTGRPLELAQDDYVSKYIDSQNTPLYHFGHGLNYSNIKIDDVIIDNRKVVVKLSNSGKKGQEVVQLYIRDLVADVIRPKKELKAFKKVEVVNDLEIEFEITNDMLKYYNQYNVYKMDNGQFEIMVGFDSKNVISHTITV